MRQRLSSPQLMQRVRGIGTSNRSEDERTTEPAQWQGDWNEKREAARKDYQLIWERWEQQELELQAT